MRRLICLFASIVLVLSTALCGTVYASPAEDPAADTTAPTTPAPAVSASDASYFDRIAVIPIDVEIPYFYQQVVNVAGMYIFTTPDGTVHKRIYGSLSGTFGWYIPVGPENTVALDAEPINTDDDIVAYEEALAAYKAENPEPEQYAGILPPEQSAFDVAEVFGLPASDIFKYSVLGALALCLFILIGYAAKSSRAKNSTRPR